MHSDIDGMWPDPFRDDAEVSFDIFEIGPDDPEERTPQQQAERDRLDKINQKSERERLYFKSMDEWALEISIPQLQAFTSHYALNSSLVDAAEIAGVTVAAIRHRREIDPVFREMWGLARDIWFDRLESVAMERATAPVDPEKANAANDLVKFLIARYEPKVPQLNLVQDTDLRVQTSIDLDKLNDGDRTKLRELSRRALGAG